MEGEFQSRRSIFLGVTHIGRIGPTVLSRYESVEQARVMAWRAKRIDNFRRRSSQPVGRGRSNRCWYLLLAIWCVVTVASGDEGQPRRDLSPRVESADACSSCKECSRMCAAAVSRASSPFVPYERRHPLCVNFSRGSSSRSRTFATWAYTLWHGSSSAAPALLQKHRIRELARS